MSDPQQVAAELSRVDNRASAENGSNTPDYVLGEFLASVLEALAQELVEVRRLREAVEDVATAYERIDGGTETVKVYAADVAAKIRAAIAGEVAGDE